MICCLFLKGLKYEFIDFFSLCMMGDIKDMNLEEKREIKRRLFLFLYYLLRLLFFDSYFKYEIIGYFLFFLDIFIFLII